MEYSNKHKNIYLVGFMGSGKSHMGKLLAKSTQRNLVDLDSLIEKEEGMSIAQIFEKGGEELFRQLEQKYLHSTADLEHSIIATGGGAPCFFDNMDFMNQHGLTVFLKTPVPILVKRLKWGKDHRPLIAQKSNKELAVFIENKLAERNFYYEQAAVVFEYKSGKEGVKALKAYL
jgi:shikimate kinase